MHFKIVASVFISVLISANSYCKEISLDVLPSACILEGRYGNQFCPNSTAYPGSSLLFATDSRTCSVQITEISKKSDDFDCLGIEINGEWKGKVQLIQGVNSIDLSKYIHSDITTIRITKLTEAMVGIICFKSIVINDEANLLPTKEKTRRLLWIGNSLTCGYGNEITVSAPPKGNPSTGFHAIHENNYYSWSSISSRKLNASAHQICYSGKGIYRNFDGTTIETLPQIFDRTYPDQIQSEKYLLDQFIPDIIIINLGTNDFGPELYSDTANADSLKFTKAYFSFIDYLHVQFSNARIILVVGNALSDQFPAGFNRLSRCRNWVQSIQENYNKTELNFFELSTQTGPFGEDWHPTKATHEKMSNEITPIIEQLMNW